MLFDLIPCMPSGKCTGCRLVEEPIYASTPEGEQLRSLRRAQGLTIGAAARELGLKALQLSGLERGRYTLSNEQWEEVLTGRRK